MCKIFKSFNKFARFTSLFSLVIKAGTENRYSPDTNFGCNRRFGPARAFTDNQFASFSLLLKIVQASENVK